jgi:hypothetical protein
LFEKTTLPHTGFKKAYQRLIMDCESSSSCNIYSDENYLNSRQHSYRVNCYGLVTKLVDQVEPKALLELNRHINTIGKMRPSLDSQGLPAPLHYVDFISQLEKGTQKSRHWQAIPSVFSLKKGDIIAYTTHKTDQYVKRCSGQHMMIVIDEYYRTEKCLWLKILDSTQSPHGLCDQRTKTLRGVGTGIIGIQFNKHGKPYALKWSVYQKGALKRYIKIVRLIDL